MQVNVVKLKFIKKYASKCSEVEINKEIHK